MSDEQVIARVWDAPVDLVRELWTTASGIASWYGQHGFTGPRVYRCQRPWWMPPWM